MKLYKVSFQMSLSIEQLIVRNVSPYDPKSYCKLGLVLINCTVLPSITTLDIGRIGSIKITNYRN